MASAYLLLLFFMMGWNSQGFSSLKVVPSSAKCASLLISMAVIGFKFVRQSTLHLRPTPFQYLRKVLILTHLHLHFTLSRFFPNSIIHFIKAVQKSIVAVNASETSTDENSGGGVSIREEGK